LRIQDLIAKKRDAKILTNSELKYVVTEICEGTIQQEQIGALLMAIYLNGMSTNETISLTEIMKDSGFIFKWENNEKFVDKHSTGGVGDKISIPLTPALAACGLKVPMIAGRGLEHTGGTIDKLESIKGFNTRLSPIQIKKIIDNVGCVITTQTEEMIPADRILYSSRDLTSTVASIPLITASIISKKAAEGISSLVLDIKVGSAAFMKDIESAEILAKCMVETGNLMGIKTSALLTEMNNPLGYMSGNALEIIESIRILKGQGPQDCISLIINQGAELLLLSGIKNNHDDARKAIKNVLNNGKALEKFKEMIICQGVDKELAKKICLEPNLLIENCKFKSKIYSKNSGFISSIDAMVVAQFILENGGGRRFMEEEINHNVGVELHVKLGDFLDKNEPWATIYHDSELNISEQLVNCLQLSEKEIEVKNRIIKKIIY
tara:strand:+ start:1299 stop:2609 length:1311 start_codon:yes stop_codon:yes gene_type:complete